MTKITPSKKITYETSPKIKFDFPDPPTGLEKLNAQSIEHLVGNFTELDAEAACRALCKKYPGMYINVFFKEFAEIKSKFEAIKSVVK